MIKNLLTLLLINIACFTNAQNVSGCYTYRSKYYEGDFVKICLKKDFTFTYVFHQNDVVGDYESSGNWWGQNDSVCFQSIQKPNFIQYGNPINEQVNIQLKDSINAVIFPYAYARCFNGNKLIAATKFDSLGFATIDLTNTTLISIKSLYSPYDIRVSDIKQENIVVHVPITRFKDISSIKLLHDPKTQSLIQTKDKKTTYYRLDLSEK